MKKETKKGKVLAGKGKNAVLGMMGLSMAMQSLAMAGGDTFNQLSAMAAGGPDTERIIPAPSPVEAGLRLSFKDSVPKNLQDQAVALALLARDIIANPQDTGARFSADPKGYLAGMGVKDTALDLNSREVKIVLALGDAEVRDAAMKSDIGRYLRLLEDRGILKYPSQVTAGVVEKGAVIPPARCVTPVVVVAEIVAVTLAAVAAASAVVAITYFWTEGVASETSAMDGLEAKVTSLLWGPKAANDIIKQYVWDKSEELAVAISDLPSVKAKNLSLEDIRVLLERHITEELGK